MKDHNNEDDPFWEMILIGTGILLLFAIAFLPAWRIHNS